MDIRPPGSGPYPDPRQGGYQPPAPPPPYGYGYPTPASGYQPAPAAPATYRPSMQQVKATWRAGGIAVGAIAAVLIAARLFYAFEHGGLAGLLLVVALVVVVAGTVLGGYFLYLKTLSVTVDAGGVTRRVFGRARRIPREALQRVILASYPQRSRYSEREVYLVALVDATGRAQLTLNLQIWSEADARALVSQLGLMGTVTQLGHREPGQLKKEVPGALPWVVEHRAATTLIVVAITLVVAIVIAVGFVLAGS